MILSIPADEVCRPFGCPDADWCRGNRLCYWNCKDDGDEMDTHTFKIGDHVRADHGPVTDPTDTTGVVEKYQDWWTMVRMSRSQILMPFMEGELNAV